MAASLQEIYDLVLNIAEDLRNQLVQRKVGAKQIETNTLSDISKVMGLIQAFELRTPGTIGENYTGIQILPEALKTWLNDAQTGSIQNDGDVQFGSDISSPATTGFNIFSQAQTYNGESFGAGDILLGDNSTGKANIWWDASAGILYFRSGTFVYNTMASSAMEAIGARVVRHTTLQSIDTATNTPIEFTIEDFDGAGFVDLGADDTKITIPTGYGGRYAIGATIQYAANSTGMRSLSILPNDTDSGNGNAIYAIHGNAGATDGTVITVSGELELNDGDFIKLNAFHRKGSALNVELAILWIRKVQ